MLVGNSLSMPVLSRNRVVVIGQVARNTELYGYSPMLRTATAATIACLLLFCPLIPEATEPEASELNELLELSLEELVDFEVVTPTQSGTPLSQTPGAVSVITYDQIRRSSAKSIPDLLRLVPGVNVRWNPMVQTIDVRSFGSNPFTSKVLLLIDGVPYNSWTKGGFPQHPGFDFFNLENIKHIEVIRGSGSALYGENAFNGVINILTLSGEEFRQSRVSAYAGERNTRSALVTHGSTMGESGSVFASFRSTRTQLPTEFWSERADADAKGYDLYLKGKLGGWQASYYRRDDSFDGYRVPTESSRLPADSVFFSADKIEQTVDITTLNYQRASEDGRLSIRSNTSYAQRDGSRCASCHAPTQYSNSSETTDHGDQFFTNALVGVHHLKNHDLLFGAEYRRIDSGEYGHDLERGSTVDGLVTAYRKTALFAQDVWSLLDGRLAVTAGIRYEGASSPKLFSSRLYPRLAAVANPTDKLTLRAAWSKAARYPSFSELYQNTWFLAAESSGSAITLATFVPNQDLRPEKIETWELGLEYELSRNLRARLDFYQNEVEDSIGIAYPRIRFENHPNDARVRGFELDLRMKPTPYLHAFANWSHQINKELGGRVDSGGNGIAFDYSPKNKANLGLNINPLSALRGSIEVSWKDEYYAPAFWYPIVFGQPERTPLRDHALVNVRMEYDFTISEGQELTLSLNGRNITDQKVYETLTGLGGRTSGRAVFVGVEYIFGT